MLIFKIFRGPEWAVLNDTGSTLGAPIDHEDGFVHFSTAEQAQETAKRHFAGQDDLVLVACAADLMGDALRWEPSRGGDMFPHLYRAMVRDDVIWMQPLPLVDGAHVFPAMQS